MKIISKFTDYYDYVSHVYGADNTVTYVRNDFETNPIKDEYYLKRIRRLPHLDYHRKHSLKWLCVCGRYYLLAKKDNENSKWNVLNEKDHPEIYDDILGRFSYPKRKYNHFVESYDEILVKLHVEIGQPVFIISRHDRRVIEISGRIPRLENYAWFKKKNKPENIWQDIQYFLSSVIRENPDKAPPVQLADKDKIVKHGFDLKSSFRKMKA